MWVGSRSPKIVIVVTQIAIRLSEREQCVVTVLSGQGRDGDANSLSIIANRTVGTRGMARKERRFKLSRRIYSGILMAEAESLIIIVRLLIMEEVWASDRIRRRYNSK